MFIVPGSNVYLLSICELLAHKPELEEEADGKAPDHERALPHRVAAEACPAPAGRAVWRRLCGGFPEVLLSADAPAGGRRLLLRPLPLGNPAHMCK